MSYLDVPRIHFAGTFLADPSTINNTRRNYNPTVPIDMSDSRQVLWDPNGAHHFALLGCTVRSAVSPTGALITDPTVDGVVGASLDSSSGEWGKLVDLDPDWQNSSQVFGNGITLHSAHGAFKAQMQTGTIRDLWFARRRTGALADASASMQTSLVDIKWDPPEQKPQSTVLTALKSNRRLSIKLVLYAYDTSATVLSGRVVGTIGPAKDGEPDHFLAERRLEPAGRFAYGGPPPNAPPTGAYGGPYGPAPFKVDAERSRLILDVGNTFPEEASGERKALGRAHAICNVPGAPIDVGDIDYGRSHYEVTAGVEELPLTASQLAAVSKNPLELRVGVAPAFVAAEQSDGSYLDVDETVFRLEPGTYKTVDIRAMVFGHPKASQTIGVRRLPGTGADLGLTVRAAKTGADGRASVRLSAGDPDLGVPRRVGIDGHIYQVALDWDLSPAGTIGTATNTRTYFLARVFSKVPPVVRPTWADVQPVLSEYAKLYPSMQALIKLSDLTDVKGHADKIKSTIDKAKFDHRDYMPITRDLSDGNRSLIQRWIAAGCPA